MKRASGVFLGLVVAAAACGDPAAPAPGSAGVARQRIPGDGCKPGAPVTIAARAVALGAGRYEITAEASPLADVDRLALEVVAPAGVTVLGDPWVLFAATGQGASRTASFRVRVAGPGAIVPVSARVTLADGIAPNRVVEVSLGAPPRPPPLVVRTLALPGGLRVDEVMP